MKILILFFISISSFAGFETMVSPEELPLFESTLESFELLPHQMERARRRQRNQRSQTPVDLDDIIKPLQDNLQADYFKQAQSVLGECQSGKCLGKNSYGASIFKDLNQRAHCYPATNCEYYRCMEEKYRCLDVGVEYFANLAKPTCEAYVGNIKKEKFSKKGNEWIYNVMVCLQKGLFEECSLRGSCPESESNEKTCEHITEFTLKFHPGCYINSGVGVCKLPLKDQINIWRTVGPFLTDRERIEAYKVVRYCLFKTPIE